MIEAREFAERLPYHPHKLTLLFSAMRHFRDALRDRGRTVHYRQCDTFRDGFAAHFDELPGDTLVCMRPSSHGAAERLRDLAETCGGGLEVVPNGLFLCSAEEFDDWAGDGGRFRHEPFYRFVRRSTGYLMTDDGPVGGDWNYDDRNRETPPSGYRPPPPPEFPPDALTERTAEWVTETFDGGYDSRPYGGGWASPEAFRWPVTRADARDALDHFTDHNLAAFGPYQDAMVEGEWAMHHSLLAAPLNLGLLHPAEVVEEVVEAANGAEDVPLNSVEGFVRQVIGWREFVRHAYRRTMPDLATANRLDQDHDLPEFYWTGETDMACLGAAIESVRRRGYSHHIQRLMVLSNFALLYGVSPQQLNRWFQAGYVDAYHWVTTPNVVEMGLHAADVFATKPYAASANYLDRMSDHCRDCRYSPDETTGEDACPFNALYWAFLDRNADSLAGNHRMALVYSHLENKSDAELEAIHDRVATIRDRAEDSDL
jgi:deoxyribodipyrimidine photolyase-related protein